MAIPAQLAFTTSFLIGIVPVFVILFYTVKNYEKYFEDRHFFFALLTSLFLSVVAGFVHILIYAGLPAFFDIVGFAVILIGLAIFETMVKLVFANLPRFKREYDTTFYSASFGFGFASFIVIAISYINITGELGASVESILSLVMFGLGVVFIQGALGIYLGYGVHKHELTLYAFYAVLMQLPFNFVLLLWYIALRVPPVSSGWELTIVAALYAFGVYYYIYTEILPLALPEDLRKHRRRSIRKGKRK